MHYFIGILATTLPLAVAIPYGITPRASKTGCTSLSFGNFSWNVEAFTYTAGYLFTTPSHQVSSGSVQFNLTNPAVSEKVTCSADSTWLTEFFYGNINYNCQAAEGSTTKTSFSFNRPSGELNINQTWTCNDEDPRFPIKFRGYGTVNLTLDCKETNYQNPDWHQGETYSDRSITCAPVTLPLKPHEQTAVA
ncbi:hypothetical protein EV127DRAFT_48244 [Xylaria flabelliformis]|nr:hypothetical protein EV127DRAFT_48244 [Xylaria flabelliformis]